MIQQNIFLWQKKKSKDEAPELEENWSWASSMYDRQFDHPYNYAYQVAINDLDEAEKKVFYEMALKGIIKLAIYTAEVIIAKH